MQSAHVACVVGYDGNVLGYDQCKLAFTKSSVWILEFAFVVGYDGLVVGYDQCIFWSILVNLQPSCVVGHDKCVVGYDQC